MSDQIKLMRLDAKIREQGGVARPASVVSISDCWAEVRIYIGQGHPSFVQCSKKHRPGHLTCHWHQDREPAAQALKAED